MVNSTPAGEGTLSNMIEAFNAEGFLEQFVVRGGRLVGVESGAEFDAEEVVIRRIERFEGVSDPDDMSIVYAIESRSGIRGTLTDAFGVYSDPAISDFLRKVSDQAENAQEDAPKRTEPDS